jgi:hypothetical protein
VEFESTEKKKIPHSNVCVIYDPRDGRIIHGHEFVGDGTGLFGPEGKKEREAQTLDGARRNHGDVSRLRVLHVPTDFRFAPNVGYRVDKKSGRLVEHHRWPPERARRKRTAIKTKVARKRKTSR